MWGQGGRWTVTNASPLLLLCRAPGSMRVISPSSVPEGGLVADAGYMGAPTASQEKLDSGQAEAAVQAALDAYRPDAASAGGAAAGTASCCGGGEVSLAAVLGGEVGGGNGIEPLVVGSRLGQPVVDGDYMGRAFPELQVRRLRRRRSAQHKYPQLLPPQPSRPTHPACLHPLPPPHQADDDPCHLRPAAAAGSAG